MVVFKVQVIIVLGLMTKIYQNHQLVIGIQREQQYQEESYLEAQASYLSFRNDAVSSSSPQPASQHPSKKTLRTQAPHSSPANNSTSPKQQVRVLVPLRPEETFFWNGAQKKLCRRIQKEQQKVGNNNSNITSAKILQLSMTISCHTIQNQNRHGNYVVGIYGMYLAALAHRAEFEFQCAEKQPMANNLFWWLQTNNHDNPSSTSLKRLDMPYNDIAKVYDPLIPSTESACRGMGKAPLQYASEQARYDLRRMALQHQEHFNNTNDDDKRRTPILRRRTSDIEFWDDAVIHFRCGDVLGHLDPKRNTNYGFVPFHVYTDPLDHSHNNSRSIGIITAPFDNARREDAPYAKMCRRVVLEFASYISTRFPGSTVTVRNDPRESMPIVYSRMVLAKQCVCFRSTFCLFPCLASLGQAHVLEGGVSYFVPPMENAYNNIHLVRANEFLTSDKLFRMGINKTIAWLKGEILYRKHKS